MAITWSQNSTHLLQPFTLQTSAGVPLDLSGVNASAITIKVRQAIATSSYTTLAGTVTIMNTLLGQIAYKFAPSDVAVPGTYKLVISVAFGPSDTWNSFEQDFIITQAQ